MTGFGVKREGQTNRTTASGGDKGRVPPAIYNQHGVEPRPPKPNGKDCAWPQINRPEASGAKNGKGGLIDAKFMKTLGIEAMLNNIFANSQWVAGKTAESAVNRGLELQKAGSPSILCYLGEHIAEQGKVEDMMKEYTHLINLMGAKGLTTSIAVRPSPFGSDVKNYADQGKGKTVLDYCYNNLETLVALAAKNKVSVCIDMEALPFSDYTLATYKALQKEYGNVSTVLQGNVRRAEHDLRAMLKDPDFGGHPPVFRLVKGIYKEANEDGMEPVAYTGYDNIHANYAKLIGIAFEESPPGTRIVVASHHDARILEALKLSERHPDKQLELQMLMGVRTDLMKNLRAAGIPVTEYVPYGPNAFAYSARRMAKSPDFANAIMADTFKSVPAPIRPLMHKIVEGAYPILFGSKLNIEAARGNSEAAAELEQYLLELPARRGAAGQKGFDGMGKQGA
ncbi:MAG: proline dehydrogenase family protein [Candidatus Burarchaeum sp.]|nr:proline dehydrogenase family protein [Candidatus Burarchaeum sp.]MDO8339243.1 proline dehydrogenase family protein [Candidatus Burarchaeum sp.]